MNARGRSSQQHLNICRASHTARCLAALLGLFIVTAAQAEEAEDPFKFIVGQSFRHDDNLFRLSDDESPPGDGSRSDTISTTSASARFAKRYSRQFVNASVGFSSVAFDKWDSLDYTTKNAAAGWRWAIGSRWTGLIDVDYDEVPRDFSDILTINDKISLNKRRTVGGSANYWFHPDWAVSGGVEQYDSSYSDSASDAAAYKAMIYDLGVTFRPASGNRLALTGRYTDGEYPNRIATSTLDEGYTQKDLRLAGEWKLSGASKLSGYVGLTKREYQNLNSKDFSGVTGRLQHDWGITGKTSLRTVARREIGAREDLTNNFVVATAFSVSPTWTPTKRISVTGMWEIKKRDFGGDPGFVVNSPSRDDTTERYRAAVAYMPLDNFNIELSQTHIERDSDVDAAEFDADITELSMKLLF